MSFFCSTCDNARTKCIFQQPVCPKCKKDLVVSLTKEQQTAFLTALQDYGPVRVALEKNAVPIKTKGHIHGCLALMDKDSPYISMEHFLWTELWHMNEVEQSLNRLLTQ